MNIFVLVLVVMLIPASVYALPKPAPVDEYLVHRDGGLIYNPLSKEAAKTGQLDLYRNAAVRSDVISGKYKLRYWIPKKATAYDVIPIRYNLSWNNSESVKPSFPVAVEATAFEDEGRRKGRDLYDLALPGKIDLQVQYLGSITAHLTPGARHNLKPDMTDKPGKYPGFERKPMVRSGVVEAGDLVWFKFRITNTGDTILDPEGMGGCQFYPELYKKNKEGKYQFIGNPYNLYIRDLEYLYPGESHEVWVHFMKNGPWETSQNFGLTPGEYRINLRMSYRWYRDFNVFCNIWDGPPMFMYEMPFTVEKESRQAAVPEGKVTFTNGGEEDKITRWIHTFEEFMTSFDCHINEPPGTGEARSLNGTLYLQVAPWTKHVVIKMIGTNPMSITTAEVPIEVESDSIQVKFDPDHQMCITRKGLLEPAIWSQCMADMRTNVQLGPYPEKHIRDRMREMMDCGINVVAFTSMPWLYDDMNSPQSNYQGDAWKYFLECARKDGMMAEGWGSYPYDRSSIQAISNWITGKNVPMENFMTDAYPAISHVDPHLPAANADAWLYQFHRWGDLYYQMPSGEVSIGIEDTRGWMRQDVHVRNPEADSVIKDFREWVKAKYGSIDTANATWGSSFTSFDEIDPQKDQVLNPFGHKWEYTNPKNPFHDWNQAVLDFDEYRTELRCRNYRDTLNIVRKEIPTVKFLLRTEGGNVVVSGIDPEDSNSHMRHIYYSQRRCALIAETLQKSGEIRWHSDYTTMPYTPSELRMLTKKAVEQGIIPIYLAQFDNMRDIAINEKYGTQYETNYNLPGPKKGQMMHVLTALFPWFKAVYEEGGVPAILWEDYQCDGFATETQKREMRFFKKKLQEALNTPEAKKARTAGKQPSQEWRRNSRAIKSYAK